MTVFDPPFPPLLIGSVRFWPQRIDLLSPEAGGRLGGVQVGFPLWRCEIETVAQSDEDAQSWASWIDRQQGAIHQIRMTDPRRWYPAAYRKAAAFPGAWSGDATGFTLNGSRDEVTMAIPTGIIVTQGDLIGFRWASGAKGGFVEVQYEGGGTAASGSLMVKVSPAVPDVVPNDAICFLLKPFCIMRLTPETEAPPSSTDGVAIGKLAAVQDLRG